MMSQSYMEVQISLGVTCLSLSTHTLTLTLEPQNSVTHRVVHCVVDFLMLRISSVKGATVERAGRKTSETETVGFVIASRNCHLTCFASFAFPSLDLHRDHPTAHSSLWPDSEVYDRALGDPPSLQ
jgi:hypothetical protein